MEVILKEDVVGLGYKHDLVSVKPGYGRNYLIPQGLAVIANAANKKVLEENVRQASHKAEKIKSDAEEIAQKIADVEISIPTKVSDTGKIFGSITNTQLSEMLKSFGIELDRRKISIDQKDIKMIGDYTATVDLHKEVKPTLRFKVVSEATASEEA